ALELNGLTVEACRQLHRALVRAVGYDHLLDLLLVQMCGGQLAHVTGAEKEDAKAFEVTEDFLRQLDRRVRNRNGVESDAGLAPDLLRNTECLLEDLLQKRIEAALLPCGMKCAADLSADRWLADDHRVQTRRHPEEMIHHFAVAKDVQIRFELLARRSGPDAHPLHDRLDGLGRSRGNDRFDAVAC